MRYLKYALILVLGIFIGIYWSKLKEDQYKKEDLKVMLHQIEKMSKLVVAKGTFSEIYNYADSKQYFYELFTFHKKAIVTVNAKVEVGYDLSLLEIEIDTVGKRIILHNIPPEEIVISPEVHYFDLQQSTFNSFSKKELNNIHSKSIEKIRETAAVSQLKSEARNRLLAELSKLYQLSSIYKWQVVDKTNTHLLEKLTY